MATISLLGRKIPIKARVQLSIFFDLCLISSAEHAVLSAVTLTALSRLAAHSYLDILHRCSFPYWRSRWDSNPTTSELTTRRSNQLGYGTMDPVFYKDRRDLPHYLWIWPEYVPVAKSKHTLLVPLTGLEPAHLSILDPKSSASASSATAAYSSVPHI